MGFDSSGRVLSSCFVKADEEGVLPFFRRGANTLVGLQGTQRAANDAELDVFTHCSVFFLSFHCSNRRSSDFLTL